MSAIYIVDHRAAEQVQKALGPDFVVLPAATCEALPAPTSSHPDMTLCPAAPGIVITEPTCFSYYKSLLAPFGVTVLPGKTTVSGNYPHDIAYNVLEAENFCFGRFDMTDPVVLSHLSERKKELISVRQGYARCSTLSFSNRLISADNGIVSAAKKAGLLCLSISSGGILLPGYDTGFIGGSSGVLHTGAVAFFGALTSHPDEKKIRAFIEDAGFTVLEIGKHPLTDIGTILRIDL